MEYYSIVSALPAVLWMAVCLTAFHGQGSSLRGRRLRVHLEWAGLDPDEIEYRMRVPSTGVDSDVATTEAALQVMGGLALRTWWLRSPEGVEGARFPSAAEAVADLLSAPPDEPAGVDWPRVGRALLDSLQSDGWSQECWGWTIQSRPREAATEEILLAGLQWLAADEVARDGHRGSNPTHDAEARYRWAAGEAASEIEDRWNGTVPLPERIAGAAGRHRCFCTDQEATSPPVTTPYGEITICCRRAARDSRWWLVLHSAGLPTEAGGYILPGTLSARRLVVQAAPLYDAEGRFWGIEARVTRIPSGHDPDDYHRLNMDMRGLPCWGAEWRIKADEITPSDVGVIDLEVECPWPARHSSRGRGTCGYVEGIGPDEWVDHRQGDLVFHTASVRKEERCFADLSPLTLDPHGELSEESEYGRPVITWPEGVTEVVISHPDHPSIRLPLGPARKVRVVQASRSVVPRRWDDGGAHD